MCPSHRGDLLRLGDNPTERERPSPENLSVCLEQRTSKDTPPCLGRFAVCSLRGCCSVVSRRSARKQPSEDRDFLLPPGHARSPDLRGRMCRRVPALAQPRLHVRAAWLCVSFGLQSAFLHLLRWGLTRVHAHRGRINSDIEIKRVLRSNAPVFAVRLASASFRQTSPSLICVCVGGGGSAVLRANK